MAEAEVVVDFGYLQAGGFNAAAEVGTVEDFAVAVGQGGKVEAGLGEAVGGGFIFLPVPQGLEDVEGAVFAHAGGGAAEDGGNLLFSEAVEELAHPDGVEAFGEGGGGVEQVGGVAVDAFGTGQAGGVLFHQLDLLGQIHDGDLHFRVVCHALQRPAASTQQVQPLTSKLPSPHAASSGNCQTVLHM